MTSVGRIELTNCAWRGGVEKRVGSWRAIRASVVVWYYKQKQLASWSG